MGESCEIKQTDFIDRAAEKFKRDTNLVVFLSYHTGGTTGRGIWKLKTPERTLWFGYSYYKLHKWMKYRRNNEVLFRQFDLSETLADVMEDPER